MECSVKVKGTTSEKRRARGDAELYFQDKTDRVCIKVSGADLKRFHMVPQQKR